MTVLAILTMALTLVPSGSAGSKYKVLYNFQGGKDGIHPSAALISDTAGNLYGVTAGGGLGGNGGCGTVFELKRVKNAWVHEILYRFPGNGNDGCYPEQSLTFDANHNLYGTTDGGQKGGFGTVFELTSVGGKWKASIVYRFAGGSDGKYPSSAVVLDGAGNLYGTAGGGASCCGMVYELTPTATDWNEQILHSFSGTDGANPFGLVFDATGNLYGTTSTGGSYEEGVAFELSPNSGGGWNESTIYNFGGFQDGAGPGPLAFNGPNLYGATDVGGSGDYGTIFELKPGTNGWSHSVLYSFTGGKDGRYPNSPFVFGKRGNLYGSSGGDVGCLHGSHWHCGNVFELKKQSGKQWALQVLHTFTGGAHAEGPSIPIFDGDGNLFGVTYLGGNCTKGYGEYCGLAFEVTP